MIVFVLAEKWDYEATVVDGVYATSALAMAASPGNWSGNEELGYTRDANKRESFDRATIEPFSVQV